MISVIIPLYNKEKYIERTLNSILLQSFNEFEILVVDDGSTDQSLKIIEKNFSDNRIKVISQKNQGVSVARNTGILHSKYELVTFLDADDTWHSQFLETIISMSNKYPKASAYYTNYKIIEKFNEEINDSSKFDYQSKEVEIEDYFKFAINNKPIHTSSIVIKKEIFKEIGGFPKGYSRGEDLYVWINIGLHYKIVYSPHVRSYYYRDVPDSLTRRYSGLEKSFANIAEEFYKKNKEFTSSIYFREYMYNIIASKAKYLIIQKKRKEARGILNKVKDTKFYKKKVLAIYLFSFFPSLIIKKILN